MSITVRTGKRGITIKATGGAAHELFMAMTRELDKKSPSSGPKPVPNRPKTETRADGALGIKNASNRLKSENT